LFTFIALQTATRLYGRYHLRLDTTRTPHRIDKILANQALSQAMLRLPAGIGLLPPQRQHDFTGV